MILNELRKANGMKKVILNNGVEMPIIGYGVYQIPTPDTKMKVLEALSAGYRLIDTAQYYGNEQGVGEALVESGIPRCEVFITTKVMSNRNVEKLIEESLKKLKTDYIDLLLIHWVMGNDIKTYQVMEKYVRVGKVRAIGLSNFYGNDYDNILKHCEIKPSVIQQETHIFYQNKELQKRYKKDGIYLEAWAPFGEGRADMFNNSTLLKIANKHDKTIAQIILRFLIEKDIIVIPKTSNKERMNENLNVFDFSLENEDKEIIETMDKNESLFNWY
ncbi:TPA: aldo/keto reductase [Listeria monocytogenes]